AMLNLRGVKPRLIDDRRVRSQKDCFAGVAEISENLREQSSAAKPALHALIRPVLYLRGAARSCELDRPASGDATVRGDPLGPGHRPNIQPCFASVPLQREITRCGRRLGRIVGLPSLSL